MCQQLVVLFWIGQWRKKMAYVHLLYSKLCNSAIFCFTHLQTWINLEECLLILYGTYFQSPPQTQPNPTLPNPTPHTMVELGAHCFMVVTLFKAWWLAFNNTQVTLHFQKMKPCKHVFEHNSFCLWWMSKECTQSKFLSIPPPCITMSKKSWFVCVCVFRFLGS
jgi:hypothetical protein